MKKPHLPLALAAAALAITSTRADAQAGDAARGKYLVTFGGCNDCHTPWKLGQNGPEPDMSRMLSGHPEQLEMPPPAPPQGPWLLAASGTMTAWAGPWGVSFASNLTPDAETGLGKWTEKDFLATIRSGRHMGRGRQLLPPMPVQNVASLPDADLRAIYAYLKTIPPIRNRVPEPRPPAATAAATPAPAPTR